MATLSAVRKDLNIPAKVCALLFSRVPAALLSWAKMAGFKEGVTPGSSGHQI